MAHPFRFARAAELAWSHRLFAELGPQLEERGFMSFKAGAQKTVCVGRGFIEFHWGGENARIAINEIKTMRLADGEFQVVHKDAGWFSRKGKFTFAYGSMANAHVLALAVDRLLGLNFG